MFASFSRGPRTRAPFLKEILLEKNGVSVGSMISCRGLEI